jgi:hypothetical protein
MAESDILSRFPKKRRPLPPEYQAIYLQHYRNSREGKSQILGLAQRAERWMHRQVAKDVRDAAPKATLEIGAGTLNQLPYEPETAPYDIIEPFRELYETSPALARVRHIYSDISEAPSGANYERITSIAVLEHIENLPELVARSALFLKDGGVLRAGIPSEGTVLWKLGWKATTSLDFRARYNLDYSVLMHYEHVNTAREIEAVLRHFFGDVRARVFGVARALSLYQFFACSTPDRERCTNYLAATSENSVPI